MSPLKIPGIEDSLVFVEYLVAFGRVSFGLSYLRPLLFGEPDVEVEFDKGKIIFLSAWEEDFSHYTIELLSSNGRIRYENEGATIQFQDVINDPVCKGYKVLNPKSKEIMSKMQHSQLNVVNQLSEYISGKASYLCSGREALNTLTSIQLIIDSIKK